MREIIEAITQSVSFRVGRMITFLPRKLRDLLRQDGGKNHRESSEKEGWPAPTKRALRSRRRRTRW